MTNARCLTEGVDLPAIDCVCFTNPKRSKVDIVQAAGRALRLAKGKKFGYILIPIFIPDGIDFDTAAEAQGFDDVSLTVRALAILKSSDYVLCEDTKRSIKLLNYYNLNNNMKYKIQRNREIYLK